MKKNYKLNSKSKGFMKIARLWMYLKDVDIRELINELAKEDREHISELEQYADIIYDVLEQYNENSKEKTMMLFLRRMQNPARRNRYVHQVFTARIAEKIAEGRGLNSKITKTGAKIHDIGHTTGGHDGEFYISKVLKNYGAGFVCHNVETVRQLVLRHDIHKKIIDKIKEVHPNLSKSKLNRIEKSLWYLDDIPACHNGEHSQKEIVVDLEKTEEKLWDDLVKCCAIPGYDRKLRPATLECGIVKFADSIEYTPNDTIDGLKEKLITKLDEEFYELYEKAGITKRKIKDIIKDRQFARIANKFHNFMINDIIENSDEVCIRMSEEAGDALYGLRKKNYKAVVSKSTRKVEQDVYEYAINELMKEFKDIVLQKDKDIVYEKNYQNEFVEYIKNTNEREYEFIEKVVDLASLETIRLETSEAIKLLKDGKEITEEKTCEYKNARIKEHMECLEAYVQPGVMELSNKEIEKYVQEVEKRTRKTNNPNYFSREEKIALRLAGEYMMTLYDEKFNTIIQEAGLITKEQLNEMSVKYVDLSPEELNEVPTSECLTEIMKNQKKEKNKKPKKEDNER